ncbi:MAG TPA: formate dehydrogenase accessory protein FdhE [Thermodesulfovibrionales bacterium]|nr:formate dehydrogenase accessory protein FdhE [Thermodesulfovibrionales bacterium]
MTVEEISDKKPHLKDALGLYSKVQKFEKSVIDLNMSVDANYTTYPPQLLGVIFKSFSSVFDIPEEFLSSLKEAMELGRIDLTRLPLDEAPAFSLPYHEEELSGLLFLISKPFFVLLKNSLNKGEPIFWQEGRCPVCHALPSLSFIGRDDARRLHCSYCEYTGPWHRIGCTNCQNRDSKKIDILEAEQEKGFRLDLCNECKSYIKTAGSHLLGDYAPELLDIMSIPLDIIAQGKGYRRHSPNPIGIKIIK